MSAKVNRTSTLQFNHINCRDEIFMFNNPVNTLLIALITKTIPNKITRFF